MGAGFPGNPKCTAVYTIFIGSILPTTNAIAAPSAVMQQCREPTVRHNTTSTNANTNAAQPTQAKHTHTHPDNKPQPNSYVANPPPAPCPAQPSHHTNPPTQGERAQAPNAAGRYRTHSLTYQLQPRLTPPGRTHTHNTHTDTHTRSLARQPKPTQWAD